MGSSWTRVRTLVPCIGRRILNHCATREALLPLLLLSFSFYPIFLPSLLWPPWVAQFRKHNIILLNHFPSLVTEVSSLASYVWGMPLLSESVWGDQTHSKKRFDRSKGKNKTNRNPVNGEWQENDLAISYKVKQILTMWPRNPTPRYLPKKNKNLCSHKTLSENVYSGFIHNLSNLETTQISFNWWTDYFSITI